MDAAYGSDLPVAPSLDLASAVGAQMKYTPVRKTHAMLADTHAAPEKGQPAQMDCLKALGWLKDICDKAAAMDNARLTIFATPQQSQKLPPQGEQSSIANLPLLGSSDSLGSADSAPSGTQQPLALPAPEPVPSSANGQLALPAPEAPGGQLSTADVAAEPEMAANDTNNSTTSLEDFEQKAFDQLTSKQPRGMKRPAAAMETKASKSKGLMKKPSAAVPPPATKETKTVVGQKKPKDDKRKLTCWGCSRCRGSPHGCEKCAFEGFKGKRMNGHDIWQKWHKNK